MKKNGSVFAALVVLAIAAPVLAQRVPPAPPSAPAVPLALAPGMPVPPPAPLPAAAPAAPLAPAAALAVPAPPAPLAPAAPPVPMEQATPQKPPRPAKVPDSPRPPDAAPAPQPPRAPEAPPSPYGAEAEPVNVRFEVTVSSQAGSAAPVKRSAMVTVSNGAVRNGPNGNSRLRAGNSVPVPTTMLTTKGEDGKEAAASRPLTSYSYRSVGLNIDAQSVTVLPGNRVGAMLNIEFSGMDDKTTGSTGAPSFPTFSQQLQLFLDSGKPLLVAQSSDIVDNVERKQTVEVKATILR